MRVTINIEVEPKITYELEQYVKSELPHIINENLFEDRKELNRLIQECVKGQIKANINDLMQGKDFRNFLRDRIAENIGMKENENKELFDAAKYTINGIEQPLIVTGG